MATVAATARVTPMSPGRRYDKVFFSGMAVLMLGIVFAGFARTYFLAGVFRAPLPAAIIHVHGAVFTLWTLIFITQTSLVASGNVAIHRKLGLWAFGLASLMVVLGIWAAVNSLARGITPVPGMDAETFFSIPASAIFIFAVLIYFGYRMRSDSAAHKRLVLLATITLMGAPTGRPPFSTLVEAHPHLASIFVWSLIGLLWLYDLWSLHKIHRASLFGGLWVVIVNQICVPIGMTAAWHSLCHGLVRLAGH